MLGRRHHRGVRTGDQDVSALDEILVADAALRNSMFVERAKQVVVVPRRIRADGVLHRQVLLPYPSWYEPTSARGFRRRPCF